MFYKRNKSHKKESKSFHEMKIGIQLWATACKTMFEYIRKTEIKYQYSLYVNYNAFTTPEAQIEEKNIWLYERKEKNYKIFSEPQRMFPCLAREATQILYYFEYAKVFWIYPIRTSWLLFLQNQEKFYFVDWLQFKLKDIQLVSPVVFQLPPPISTIEFPPGLLSDLIFSNEEYYSALDNRIQDHVLLQMDKYAYKTLCMTFYGQFRYQKFVKVIQKQYPYLKSKPPYQKIFLTLPKLENPEEVYTVGPAYAYTCPLMNVEDGSTTFDYKIATGFKSSIVLLVMDIHRDIENHSEYTVLEMIENIFVEAINDVF